MNHLNTQRLLQMSVLMYLASKIAGPVLDATNINCLKKKKRKQKHYTKSPRLQSQISRIRSQDLLCLFKL